MFLQLEKVNVFSITQEKAKILGCVCNRNSYFFLSFLNHLGTPLGISTYWLNMKAYTDSVVYRLILSQLFMLIINELSLSFVIPTNNV